MYRQRSDIVASMLASLLSAIPDAYTGEDGVIRIVYEIEAGQLENLYLAHQLLLEDMFVQTASFQALIRHGEQYGLEPLQGTVSEGQLQFTGEGGTYIPVGTEVAYDPTGAAASETSIPVVYFRTTEDGTIPDTGNPTPPAAAVNATAGNLNGLYEYVITFVSSVGETLPSSESNAVNPVNQQVNLSNLPVGGPGTTTRRIYRDKNGAGTYRMIAEIDNLTTTYTDDTDDATAATGSLVPSVDTAHSIVLDAEAEEPGVEGNVSAGVINDLANAPSSLSGVTNPAAFTGGSDPQDTEDFRQALLSFIQNPQTGAPPDLQEWAAEIEGVGSASIFPNVDDTGASAPGTVTIRITGVNGAQPSSDLISEVQSYIETKDLANITVIVAAFTAVPLNVTVSVELDSSYTLDAVTPSVQAAIQDYINSVDVGGTIYLAGIIDAVYGLSGIINVVVTAPSADTPSGDDTDKFIPGTITVNQA